MYKWMTREKLFFALFFAVALLAWAYFDTFRAIVVKWGEDVSYRHGYLMLPISAWLVWRVRGQLADQPVVPSLWGILALIALTLLWQVSAAVGVQVVEQLAVVAMIPALVVAIVGLPIARILAFPLGFLMLAVPFGQGLLPFMMHVTADVSTWALHLTGIPVYRSHMYLTIPYGKFEIAKACGGLKYVITGLVLGALYTYLSYRTWWKRALSMLVFLVVPLLANALRVYLIVVVSYLTEFRFGPGAEHVEFGRVLFIVVMVALFWIGRRWAEDETSPPVVAADNAPSTVAQGPGTALIPLAALVLVALGPYYLQSSVLHARVRLSADTELLRLPGSVGGWAGPVTVSDVWKPVYSGAYRTVTGTYRRGEADRVDVAVSVYGLGSTGGAEMISYRNVLSSSERDSLVDLHVATVPLGQAGELRVRETTVTDERGTYLVWHWYMVGEVAATDSFVVKAREAFAFLSRGAHEERVVTVATVFDARAPERLRDFASAYAACLKAGFDPESCSG